MCHCHRSADQSPQCRRQDHNGRHMSHAALVPSLVTVLRMRLPLPEKPLPSATITAARTTKSHKPFHASAPKPLKARVLHTAHSLRPDHENKAAHSLPPVNNGRPWPRPFDRHGPVTTLPRPATRHRQCGIRFTGMLSLSASACGRAGVRARVRVAQGRSGAPRPRAQPLAGEAYWHRSPEMRMTNPHSVTKSCSR